MVYLLLALIVTRQSYCKKITTDNIATSIEELPERIVYRDIYVEFGSNIGQHLQNQVLRRLQEASNVVVRLVNYSDIVNYNMTKTYSSRALVLSFGNATLSLQKLPSSMLNQHAESYNIVGNLYSHNHNGLSYIVCNGRPLRSDTHQNVSFNKDKTHYGAALCIYSTLELLGYGFFHPLDPYIPAQLSIPINYNNTYNGCNITREYKIHQLTPNNRIEKNTEILCTIDVQEAPYWPERGFHIHTQHPLEVTEVLQGYDIPQFGPHSPECNNYQPYRNSKLRTNDRFNAGAADKDKQGYCELWESMVDDVNSLFEWALANRLNKIEWLLLGNFKFADDLDTRMKRLQLLTSLGHEYSILVGADCPIGNIQQHAWHIVNTQAPFREQLKQIHNRVDWIFNAGFDFLTTESGLSEFTHPECDLMLDLMNEFANYINGTWGREAAIKVHCSTGQTCHNYLDPVTNTSSNKLNFNFLPTYATSALGVFPHTVQVYALDDNTAGAYGNQNFSYMEDYLVYEAKQGKRSVVYYGETAYWVNVDVDVPLFLPVYGQRRQHDLRRIAGREIKEGFRMDGQMNFDSGWEWGYWLSDVVTARASWNPFVSPHVSESTYAEGLDQWDVFSKALLPITSIFGHRLGTRLNSIITTLAKVQADVLLNGIVDQQPSVNLNKLSGIAYLSGTDTWVDLPRKFGLHFLQPDKIHFKETDDPQWGYVLPLLHEMENKFQAIKELMSQLVADAEEEVLSVKMETVGGVLNGKKVTILEADRGLDRGNQRIAIVETGVDGMQEFEDISHASNRVKQSPKWYLNENAMEILRELDDCIAILVLRVRHVRLLYESRDHIVSPSNIERAVKQKQSRNIINDAHAIVSRREDKYRVPKYRIAAWRDNPTVYRYGYLWSVHSLYYWWRDQGRAEEGSIQSEWSPCYLNRMDVTEIAVGWGKLSVEIIRNLINRYLPFNVDAVNCFASPSHEYKFPGSMY